MVFDIHAHEIQTNVRFEGRCKTTFSEMAGSVATPMVIPMERQHWKMVQGNDADDMSAHVGCISYSSHPSALLSHEI